MYQEDVLAKTADGGYGPLGQLDNEMKEFIREVRGELAEVRRDSDRRGRGASNRSRPARRFGDW